MPGRFYVLRGHEVVETTSMMEAAIFMGDTQGRTVAKTPLTANGAKAERDPSGAFIGAPQVCEVSTVFLTIDHNHFGEGPPIVFETLVFGGPMDDWMRRYATWDEAVTGHDETVELVRRALQGEKPAETDATVLKYERRTWHDRVLNDDD